MKTNAKIYKISRISLCYVHCWMHVNQSRLWQLAAPRGQGVHVMLFRQRKSSCEVKSGRKKKCTCGGTRDASRSLAPTTFMAVYTKVEEEPHKFFLYLSTGDRPTLFAKEHSTQRLM